MYKLSTRVYSTVRVTRSDGVRSHDVCSVRDEIGERVWYNNEWIYIPLNQWHYYTVHFLSRVLIEEQGFSWLVESKTFHHIGASQKIAD